MNTTWRPRSRRRAAPVECIRKPHRCRTAGGHSYTPSGEKLPLPRWRRHQPSDDAGADLCGATSYFNPSGGSSRLWQYRLFRARTKRQGLHLTTTELAFGDVDFALSRGKDDADALVQRRVSRDNVLWQKERLLNLALAALPGQCL